MPTAADAYQWQFTPPGGSATSPGSSTQLSSTISYIIPAMGAGNVGAYTVTVNSEANLPVTSAVAHLTLAPPGSNLALRRLATASSVRGICTDATTPPPYSGLNCNGAENAVNGNLATTSERSPGSQQEIVDA
jgi:beta-galactosidase